jgi:hypothetical protein
MHEAIERRQRYRTAVRDSIEIAVDLEVADNRHIAAELLDLAASGAGVLCQEVAGLSLGAAVVLRLTTPNVALRLDAVVVSTVALEEGRRLGLQFRDEIRADLDVPSPVRELLNRRRAVRVAPAGAVDVVLKALDDTSGATQTLGLLIDVSTSGLSAWFDRELGALDSVVLISFELQPGLPLDFAARVRDQKRGIGPRVRLTLEIDPEDTVGYAEQVRALSLYIGARQQELVRAG